MTASYEERRKDDVRIKEIQQQLDSHSFYIKQHNGDISEVKKAVNGNSGKIDDLITSTNTLTESVAPILSGIHSIEESVKVLRWVGTGVKWVITTFAGLFVYIEYVHDWFVKGS